MGLPTGQRSSLIDKGVDAGFACVCAKAALKIARMFRQRSWILAFCFVIAWFACLAIAAQSTIPSHCLEVVLVPHSQHSPAYLTIHIASAT